MEILIFIIAIVMIVIKASSKGVAGENQPPEQTAKTSATQRMTATSSTATNRTYQRSSSTAEKPWEMAARENIEKAARRASAAANKALNEIFMDVSTSTDNSSASDQIQKRRLENRHTSILNRAKDNAGENIQDVTLSTMEMEHNHLERVGAAEHYHPEDEIPENMLGTIEDLMIKGYDGNLCFERDFVGEAMDMISRFTAPTEVPEYSGGKVS